VYPIFEPAFDSLQVVNLAIPNSYELTAKSGFNIKRFALPVFHFITKFRIYFENFRIVKGNIGKLILHMFSSERAGSRDAEAVFTRGANYS
jgi:hypothetical protein